MLLLGAQTCQPDLLLLQASPRFPPIFGHDFEEVFSVLPLFISSNKHSSNTYGEYVTNITSVLEEEGVEEEGLRGERKQYKEALPVQAHWCQD